VASLVEAAMTDKLTPFLDAQTRMAVLMFGVHKLLSVNVKDEAERWGDLDRNSQAYFYAMSSVALDTLSEIDGAMVGAALEEWRKPVDVTGLDWTEQRTQEFGRIWSAALQAAHRPK
jgi:hypothetical protein